MVRKKKVPGQPQDPRGGARVGTPGTSYSNRSDLRQAVRTAPSKEYGQRAAAERAQQAAPLPQAPPPPAAGGAAGAAGGGGFAPGYVEPGGFGEFTRSTERPDEPLTTGIPSGPGAGPEALSSFRRPDADLEALRPYLPTLELLASQPNASPTARTFVRRLRGAMPPPGAGA